MPDQDYAVLAALLFAVLLIAMVMPAPARPPRNEAGLHLTLLGAGSALAILAGVLALAHLPVHSAVFGAFAWLIVMPCVWMARAPRPAEGYGGEEDEDDDGGEPWPRWPGAPPSPDVGRPQAQLSGLAGVQVAWARPAAHPSPAARLPQHATAGNQPAACATAVVSATPATCATAAPGATPAPDAPDVVEPVVAPQQRRLKARPRGERADHRSIVHIRAASPHGGRRRRANLRRRALRRCRMWLWPAPPECVTFVEPEHEQLRRRPGADVRHGARSGPLD